MRRPIFQPGPGTRTQKQEMRNLWLEIFGLSPWFCHEKQEISGTSEFCRACFGICAPELETPVWNLRVGVSLSVAVACWCVWVPSAYRVWPRVCGGQDFYRPIFIYTYKRYRARRTHPKRERSLSRSVSQLTSAGVCHCAAAAARQPSLESHPTAVSSPRLPPRLVLALGLVALDLLQDQLLLPVDAALPLLARGLASPVCHKGRKLSCSSTAPLQQRQRGALPRSQP